MGFVLDASALAKLFLEEEGYREMRSWFRERIQEGDDLFAPHLASYELGRIIQRTHGDLDPDEQAQLLSTITDQLAFGWPPDVASFQAGGEHGLTFYDASYLALASDGEHTLVTADGDMVQAAEASGPSVRGF